MSCINNDDKCKYYENGDCGFCYMGDGYPYHAPCFVWETHLAEMESCSTPEFYTMPSDTAGIRAYTTMEHIITATFHVVE